MKNFYDATIIKPNLRLGINIKLVPVEQCYCTTIVNGAILNMGLLTNSISLVTDIGLTSPINIEISIERIRHPQAIIIELHIAHCHSLITYQLSTNNYQLK